MNKYNLTNEQNKRVAEIIETRRREESERQKKIDEESKLSEDERNILKNKRQREAEFENECQRFATIIMGKGKLTNQESELQQLNNDFSNNSLDSRQGLIFRGEDDNKEARIHHNSNVNMDWLEYQIKEKHNVEAARKNDDAKWGKQLEDNDKRGLKLDREERAARIENAHDTANYNLELQSYRDHIKTDLHAKQLREDSKISNMQSYFPDDDKIQSKYNEPLQQEPSAELCTTETKQQLREHEYQQVKNEALKNKRASESNSWHFSGYSHNAERNTSKQREAAQTVLDEQEVARLTVEEQGLNTSYMDRLNEKNDVTDHFYD